MNAATGNARLSSRSSDLRRIRSRYHTFCLELAGVPNAPEWMCPLCEVDQLSANEDLYDDSDLDELQHILFDESMLDGETDVEVRVEFLRFCRACSGPFAAY